jgi:hypothetical protein
MRVVDARVIDISRTLGRPCAVSGGADNGEPNMS